MDNKTTLNIANAAVTKGDHEGFLSFCTEDTIWTFVGDRTLNGKQAVREYMAAVYTTPPEFVVETLIAEGDYVTAIGKISLKYDGGELINYSYCDVWRFHDGKLHELKAFVIKE